jgi:hypothetical protein
MPDTFVRWKGVVRLDFLEIWNIFWGLKYIFFSFENIVLELFWEFENIVPVNFESMNFPTN